MLVLVVVVGFLHPPPLRAVAHRAGGIRRRRGVRVRVLGCSLSIWGPGAWCRRRLVIRCRGWSFKLQHAYDLKRMKTISWSKETQNIKHIQMMSIVV
jgi:hypothetical protein